MQQALMIFKFLLCIAKLNCENLQGKNVSGFHVETNLQVITATETDTNLTSLITPSGR